MKLSTSSILLLLPTAFANSHQRKRLNEKTQRREADIISMESNDFKNWFTTSADMQPEESSNSSSNQSNTDTSSSQSSNSIPSAFSGRASLPITSRMGCPSGQRKLQMKIKLDLYGEETTWVIQKKSNGKKVMSNSRTYSANDEETVESCVDSGNPEEHYELILYDKVGDGICCKSGDGAYTLSIEEEGSWTPLVSGGNFKKKEWVHLISVRSHTPALSGRDEEWLVAHNTRRQYWHSYYKKTYVPLKWSGELAESSRVYATKLLDTCDDPSIEHDPDNYYGENMAKNKGTGGWGQLYTADKVTGRFIDREVEIGYPNNYHMTQALWRASRYVGCADAEKPWNGGTCRIQVCRYSKAGNCDMNRSNWEEKMMMDDSGCFPDCPPEGCF